MSNPYKYRVPFKRTSGWYDNEGTWYQISTWCNRTLGPGNWDYFYDGFVFEKESDYMLFKLKWL
jgi:hypothetical protein